MKTLIVAAAAALMASGSAYAYQSYPSHTTHTTHSTTAAEPVVAVVDPKVVLVAPVGWTAEQRTLWEEQMDYHPGWTAAQVAAFEAMMALPPASWTAEQRALYAAHLNHIPTAWTAAQRAAFAAMVEPMRTPWLAATQTATYEAATTTYATAPASGSVVQPSNASPERDARGIAVISSPAFVPAGYNGIPATAVGGPAEGDDASYPPCTAEITDNCLQTYEVGSNPD